MLHMGDVVHVVVEPALLSITRENRSRALFEDIKARLGVGRTPATAPAPSPEGVPEISGPS